jgi:hypothetical protein
MREPIRPAERYLAEGAGPARPPRHRDLRHTGARHVDQGRGNGRSGGGGGDGGDAVREDGNGGLSGGCFWGIQLVYQHVKGVVNAESGYLGGSAEAANYDQIEVTAYRGRWTEAGSPADRG